MCPDASRPGPRAAAFVLLLALAAGVAAQALPAALQSRLATMAPAQRAELQHRQARLMAMTPAARAAFLQRVAAWDGLPAADRARRREAWTTWHALPAAERSVV